MQAIGETIFSLTYLVLVIGAGRIMLQNHHGNATVKKIGLMAVLLGCGDAFHLLPRIYALWTTGFEANAVALGIGKFVTSITMTLFYVLLYYIWREYYKEKEQKGLTFTIWGLVLLRILLCLLPQNEWLAYNPPLWMGIVRNLPFALLGIIMIVLFVQQRGMRKADPFYQMPVAIFLSFACYVPVVLFSSTNALVGMLMIPKTMAYMWMVFMGWRFYITTSKH